MTSIAAKNRRVLRIEGWSPLLRCWWPSGAQDIWSRFGLGSLEFIENVMSSWWWLESRETRKWVFASQVADVHVISIYPLCQKSDSCEHFLLKFNSNRKHDDYPLWEKEKDWHRTCNQFFLGSQKNSKVEMYDLGFAIPLQQRVNTLFIFMKETLLTFIVSEFWPQDNMAKVKKKHCYSVWIV